MMQAMRDNMKVVIWATAIAFLVGFGVLQLGGVLNPPTHGGPAGVIAKINGEPVRYEEFNGMYKNILNQLRQSREIKEGEDSYIREQAWSDMITSKLVQQEVRRRRITVTPEEIKTMVRVAPPDFVMQAPGFQTNGKFDYRKYLAELDNPNSQVPWVQVEDYVAQTLPQQKLQQEIVATAKVSEADVRERFQLLNEKMNVRYICFAADSFVVDTSKIGGADIETYYRSHPEEFTGPPEVTLVVTMVPHRPKEPDFAVARERMMGIREQIAALPDSFPRYARTYSEAGTLNPNLRTTYSVTTTGCPISTPRWASRRWASSIGSSPGAIDSRRGTTSCCQAYPSPSLLTRRAERSTDAISFQFASPIVRMSSRGCGGRVSACKCTTCP